MHTGESMRGYGKPRRAFLLGFAVNDVAAQQRVVLLQLETRRVVTTVLLGVVHVTAFGAAHLHEDAIAFFSHCSNLQKQHTARVRGPKKSLRWGLNP